MGTRHELGLSWLMPARAALQKALPHVTVHLRLASTNDLEHAVSALRADAIIGSRAPATRRITTVDLHREDYDLVGAPALLRRRKFSRAADAQRHVLLDADDDLPLFSYFRTSGVSLEFERIITLGAIEAIRAAVIAGEGVAVLPRYYVRDDIKRRRLRRLLPRAELGSDFFRLIFRADDPRRRLLTMIAEVLQTLPLR